MNYTKLLNALMMKNGLKIKLHRKYFIALALLSLLGISTTSQATECFEKFRNMCVKNKGKINWVGFNCSDSESQLSNKIYDFYDETKSEWPESVLDDYIIREQRGLNIRKSGGGDYSEDEFSVCFRQEQKKYYQTGKRPSSNASSNQSSSSGSSSQSNQKANRQSANNQSNQNSSNKPQPDPMGEMGDILGGVTESKSSSGLNMKPEQAAIVNEASQTYATKTAAFEESHKGLRRTHNKEDEASRCLKMDGRQITNTCDYRVEYIFCAYNPDQNAFKAAFEMAAAFDCEKRQMGMQGVRPKGKQAGTFTAEAVFVFGCKDPSLPAGVTYERGRGLSGRCE